MNSESGLSLRRTAVTVPVNFRDPMGLWRCNTQTLCFEPVPDPGPGRHGGAAIDPDTPPIPGPTDGAGSGADLTGVHNAQLGLNFIAEKNSWSTKCADTLTAATKGGNVGQSVDLFAAMKAGARDAVVKDGTTSQDKVQNLYAGAANPTLAGLVDPTLTVSTAFANGPGTSAMAALGGNAIYIRPDSFAAADSALSVATLMHELLHNITGLTDSDLMRNLNLPEPPKGMGSFDITLRMFTDCVAQ